MKPNSRIPERARPEDSTIGRRAIVKGASWSVPVIAMATAAPLASASTCTPGSSSFTVIDASGATAGNHLWTVPDGVDKVHFVVIGGAGGATKNGAGVVTTGGRGAEVTGELTVTPGESLTIVVGQGGRYLPTGNSGGQGFGNGGSAGLQSLPAYYQISAGGGGGSAILRADTPLIVAGGGGGSGHRGWAYASDANSATAGIGGDADADAPDRTISGTTAGGGKSSGSGGVASGALTASTSGANSTGRDGANGILSSRAGQNPIYTENVVSGGGGGGYQGGGSGAVAYFHSDDPNNLVQVHISAGGGGGTSYLAPGVTGTVLVNQATSTDPAVRVPGSVVLSWTC